MIPDAALEAALSEKWALFLSAVKRDDPSASQLWRKLKDLHDQRTPEQRARALVLAGLKPDCTPLDPKPGTPA